jgi:hypothetical protein
MTPAAMREKFRQLAKSLQAAQDEPAPQHAHMITGSLLVRGNIVLQGSLADEYMAALAAMAPLPSEESPWSPETIDDAIATTLLELLQSEVPDKELALKQACQKFFEKINQAPKTYSVSLGVFGFHLSCEGIQFGKIKLVNKVYTPGRDLAGYFVVGVPTQILLAEVDVSAADFNSARRIAQRFIDQHLSILNAVCSDRSPSYVRLSRMFSGLEYVTITDFSGQTETPNQILAGTSRQFIPLSATDLQRSLAERGGTRISSMLLCRNSFSDRIIPALEIAGAACIEPKEHESLLLFAIALESAVLGRDTQAELTMQLAVRTAHLISSSLTGRKAVAKAIKRLYGLRSKIVHTGSISISKDDVDEMRLYCLATLLALTTRKEFLAFSEASELDVWFEDQLLSASAVGVENNGALDVIVEAPE